MHSLASTLLKHLKSTDSRKNAVRIVGGDFNKLPSRAPELFNSILVELDCSPPPFQNSYRQHNGYQAPLDFFLLQTPMDFHQLLSSSKCLTFWPKYQPVGHGIHICKFPRIIPIASSPDDLPAPTIPTSAFYLPPSSQIVNNPNSASNLQPLIRSLLSLSSPSLLSVKAAIWSWWRHSSRTSKSSSPSYHYNLLQRKLREPKSLQCILPRSSWEWLVSHFPSVSSSHPIVHDIFVSVPVILLSRLLTQYDILFSPTDRPIPRSQFSTPPSHTWHNVAMLPLKLHDIQVLFAPLLVTSVKLRQTSTVRCAPQGPFGRNIPVLMILPGPLSSRIMLLLPHRFLLVPLLHMMISITPSSPLPDSAPGADGSPYTAWRVCPSISTTSLAHHFQNILHRKVSPPTQALVSSPKRTRANTLTIIDRSGYQIPVIVSSTERLTPYSVKRSLGSYTLLRRYLTFFVNLKVTTWLFSNFWIPRRQPTVSFYLILLKLLSALTLTG